MNPTKEDGPIGINIRHTRHGGWNRHETAVQKEVQHKLNQILTSFDVGLSAFEHINLFLEFSDRNGKRTIGLIRSNRNVVSAKVELDWRDKVDCDYNDMELLISRSACSLILGIVSESKNDPSKFLTALTHSALPAPLVDLLIQSQQSLEKPQVLDATSNMTDNRFWDLLAQSKSICTNPSSVAEHAEKLIAKLLALAPGEILDFQIIQQRQLAKAYTWELWAIAYMACDGCSDDAFEDFRAWLLTLGQDNFNRCLQQPQFLVDYLSPLLPVCIDSIWDGERILLAAIVAFEQKTGWSLTDILSFEDYSFEKEPLGRPWDEENICTKFPQWCTQFAHEHL